MRSATQGPQRSDAQRNRERVLETAVAELTRDPDVALSVIAKRAGVGQGTFYRNFPNRETLVIEVYRREVQQLVESASALLERLPPVDALRAWLDGLARFAMAKAGLAGALGQAVRPSADAKRPGYELVLGVVEDLLEANRRAGTARSDITAADFVLVIAGIWQVDPSGDWEGQMGRLLDVVVAGLRPPRTDSTSNVI